MEVERSFKFNVRPDPDAVKQTRQPRAL